MFPSASSCAKETQGEREPLCVYERRDVPPRRIGVGAGQIKLLERHEHEQDWAQGRVRHRSDEPLQGGLVRFPFKPHLLRTHN